LKSLAVQIAVSHVGVWFLQGIMVRFLGGEAAFIAWSKAGQARGASARSDATLTLFRQGADGPNYIRYLWDHEGDSSRSCFEGKEGRRHKSSYDAASSGR